MTACPVVNLLVKGKRSILDKQSPYLSKRSNDPSISLPPFPLFSYSANACQTVRTVPGK